MKHSVSSGKLVEDIRSYLEYHGVDTIRVEEVLGEVPAYEVWYFTSNGQIRFMFADGRNCLPYWDIFFDGPSKGIEAKFIATYSDGSISYVDRESFREEIRLYAEYHTLHLGEPMTHLESLVYLLAGSTVNADKAKDYPDMPTYAILKERV